MKISDGFVADAAGREGRGPERSVGTILVELGKLRAEGVEKILRLQKEQGARFGEAAITLGLVTRQDLQLALAVQYDYPILAPGDGGISRELVAAYEPFSPIVESLRALRSQLMLRWFTDEPERRALAVVSPARKEGRSHLAANLAVVFSQLGEHTLLIDADLRHPRQHLLFNLGNAPGLAAILGGRGEGDAIQRIESLADLSVLPAGAVPPNPQELLSRGQFTRLLEQVTKAFDVVIVDTPAGAESSDAQTAAVRCGGALLVARRHHTRMDDAQRLAAGLSEATVRMVGAVVNEY